MYIYYFALVAIDTHIILLIYICIIYRLVIVIEIVDVLLT